MAVLEFELIGKEEEISVPGVTITREYREDTLKAILFEIEGGQQFRIEKIDFSEMKIYRPKREIKKKYRLTMSMLKGMPASIQDFDSEYDADMMKTKINNTYPDADCSIKCVEIDEFGEEVNT